MPSLPFDFYLSDLNTKVLMVQSGITVAQRHGIPVVELYPVLEAEAGIFTSDFMASRMHLLFRPSVLPIEFP